MSFEELKSKVEVAGSLTCQSDSQSAYFLLVISEQLREAGHAVVFDETFSHEGQFIEAHLTHYLTCNKCKQKAKEN